MSMMNRRNLLQTLGAAALGVTTVSGAETPSTANSRESGTPAPQLDQYGGITAVRARATGFFRVERINERWWFITPALLSGTVGMPESGLASLTSTTQAMGRP